MRLFLLPNRLVRPVGTLKSTRTSLGRLPILRTYASKPEEMNPLLEQYYKQQSNLKEPGQQVAVEGKLTEESIFYDPTAEPEAPTSLDNVRKTQPVVQVSPQTTPRTAEQIKASKLAAEETETKQRKLKQQSEMDPRLMEYALDPNPGKRWSWERKQVIKQVRNGWKLTKKDHIRLTEKECILASPQLKTSMKKLGMLARQIAGKTIDEALLQMRFSKKRTAVEVAKHLEHARNVAIVKWGMGLGKAQGQRESRVRIRTKDGEQKVVTDATGIYIAQAWVNKHPFHMAPEFRARGRVNTLKQPWTSLVLMLKEEKTRIREHNEREQKEANSKLWVHLPDKPISQQRQYLLW